MCLLAVHFVYVPMLNTNLFPVICHRSHSTKSSLKVCVPLTYVNSTPYGRECHWYFKFTAEYGTFLDYHAVCVFGCNPRVCEHV